jgi:hypothetical protein
MQYENGANKELYKEIQKMSPEQRQHLVQKCRAWEEDQQRYGFADGGIYPVRYLSSEHEPTPRENTICPLLLDNPHNRPAERRKSTAETKNKAQVAMINTMNSPMTMAARNHIMEFAGPGYDKVATFIQQRKPKFGAESKTKEQIFDKRFPWGGSKKRRKNKRKSRKFIRK